MARRKIVMLVAGLAALALGLGAGLGGCKDLTFNGDMKGFLEYWTDTVRVAAADDNLDEVGQRVSSGRTTVATNATITATLTISNPEGYPLESVVSSAADGPHAVEVSGPAASAVLGLTRVTAVTPTSLSVEVSPFSQVPTPASLALEHTDFTVKLSPTRSDTAMQSPNPLVLNLRYNTPPRMPLEVVYNDKTGKLERLGDDRWELVQGTNIKDLDDNIYWAYPSGIQDPKNPDYVAGFQIYEADALEIEEAPSYFSLADNFPSLTSLVSPDLAGYDVYAAPVSPGVEISIKAVDGEGVKSHGTVSDKAPRPITLEGNGGIFGSSKGSVTVYKSEDSVITGGDLDVPTYPGLSLSGWAAQPDGSLPITFPHTVSSLTPTTFYAQWQGNTYTVTFDANSGTGGSSSLTAAYDQPPPPILSPLPTKDGGYTFAGYNTQRDGSGTYYYDAKGDAQGTWKEMANTVLYAQWDSVYQEPTLAGGKYEISDHEHLLWIGQQLKSGAFKTVNLKLTADIVIPSDEWVPIDLPDGSPSTFDGQGHSITFEGTSGGLFVDFNYSTIENLVLKGNITGNSVKGALLNMAYCTVIRNVMSLVTITNTGTGATGGLVGTFGGRDRNGQVSTIENCAVYADVSSNGYAGGLVGELWNGNQYGKILNSVYMGEVTGNKAGAVVGYNNSNQGSPSTLQNIYYCVTNNSNIAVIGDTGAGGTVVANVVSKTDQEIASADAANLLGSQWEYKAGEKYPTLRKNP